MSPLKRIRKKVVYEFHKYKKQLLNFDTIICIVFILLLGVFRPDWVVITAFFIVIPYILLTKRKALLYHLLIAFFVALGWMLISKDYYGYNENFVTIAGINLFPLFAWASGLLAIYLIYSHYEHIVKPTFLRRLGLFIAFYWPSLIVFDTIGYHLFNIVNIKAAAYKGLPICDCTHFPAWMQAAYFLIGIVFFALCYIAGLKNPHYKVKNAVKSILALIL